jgi:hypothetical protein
MNRLAAARLALCAAVLLLGALPAQAEYCLNYSSWLTSQMRKAGSYNTYGCTATEAQCKAEKARNPSHYVGDCYPTGASKATTGKSGGGAVPGAAATQAGAAAEKKIQAQQRAEQEAEQRAAQQARQDLLGGEIKGVAPFSSGLTIKLPPPAAAPPGGTARSQLDCVTRSSSASANAEPGRLGQGVHDDFVNADDCRPLNPAVPLPGAPVPVDEAAVPREPAALARWLESLLARQREVQQQLARQDGDITRLEAEVARQQQAPKVDLKTEPAESDALRRARAALAKARAERQKTAAEYEQLQQQAQQARQQQATP